MKRMIQCAVVGAAGLAIGWAIIGVGALVVMGRFFEQADLDDDIGGLDPRQALDRLRMRNAYINDDTLWPDFDD